MKTTFIVLSTTALLGLSACTNMSDTQQRTLSGAGIGAAAGVGIGALTGGGLLWGAAGGAAVGAAGGYIYDQYEKDKKKNPPKSTSTKSIVN
ncbi:glycine zipper domain-containing protein [Polynucleobacter sp.]|jgi:osmotically inducible lipoprotein OsmB|uniref:glycine zipper domain-containing protein n=1 Tax=Polynucleobacter sp. TaxID=2029855 RepID=UPI0037C7A1A5